MALTVAIGLVFPNLFRVMQGIFGGFALVCFHLVTTWHTKCSVFSLIGLFEAVLESPVREKSEYIREFILHSPFSYALFVYFIVGLFLSWKASKREISTSLKKKFQVVVLGMSIISLSFPASVWCYSSPPPLLITQSMARAIETEKALAYRRVSWHLQDIACNSPYQKVVIILGESANRDFMSLYGYPLNTTPFLDSLVDKPSTVVFRAISGGDKTTLGIPLLLTDATVANFDTFYTAPGLPSLLEACGYQTFWFSAQEEFSFFTTTVTSIAREADMAVFLPHMAASHVYDEQLLSLLVPSRVKPAIKQAFFFHLMGSHFIYSERYPRTHALNLHPKTLLDHYINTIYYTDWVISQIVLRFQTLAPDDTILFVYVSDHGEYLTSTVGEHGTKHQDDYRVPFILWSNHTTDNILEVKARASSKPYIVNTECFLQVIKFMVGIIPTFDLSYNPQVLHLLPDVILDYNELPSERLHEHVP